MAFLLNISPSYLSKLEKIERIPTSEVLIGAEFLFGEPAAELFPALYDDVEVMVGAQARNLYDRIESRTDLNTEEKLRMLSAMIDRLKPVDPDL